jgi:hypothetical protein
MACRQQLPTQEETRGRAAEGPRSARVDPPFEAHCLAPVQLRKHTVNLCVNVAPEHCKPSTTQFGEALGAHTILTVGIGAVPPPLNALGSRITSVVRTRLIVDAAGRSRARWVAMTFVGVVAQNGPQKGKLSAGGVLEESERGTRKAVEVASCAEGVGGRREDVAVLHRQIGTPLGGSLAVACGRTENLHQDVMVPRAPRGGRQWCSRRGAGRIVCRALDTCPKVALPSGLSQRRNELAAAVGDGNLVRNAATGSPTEGTNPKRSA